MRTIHHVRRCSILTRAAPLCTSSARWRQLELVLLVTAIARSRFAVTKCRRSFTSGLGLHLNGSNEYCELVHRHSEPQKDLENPLPTPAHPRRSERKERRNATSESHTSLVIDALLVRGYSQVERYKDDRLQESPSHAPEQIHRDGVGESAAGESLRLSSTGDKAAQLASGESMVSQKSILANYIRSLHDVDFRRLDKDQKESYLRRLKSTFDKEALDCLDETGFSPVDVVSWAWILCAPTSFQAAARLHAVSNRPLISQAASTPTFLLQMILLRQVISPSALQLLLLHSSDRLANRTIKDWPLDLASFDRLHSHQLPKDDRETLSDVFVDQRPYPGMTDTAIITLVVKLMRHARKVYPELLPQIAQLFVVRLNGHGNRKRMEQAQLSFVYNKMLLLLSYQSSQFFKNVRYHQHAQMTIIRAMGEFDPPLFVDRTGYRAVITVQLAHEKAISEQNWARHKAKSWPPWQDPRLGIDENPGEDAGVTRAGTALSQLMESGYGLTEWEDGASILAGWDTDNSPTIQTRRYYPANASHQLTQDASSPASIVWTSRIQATRTVEEAWAVFLACREALCDTEEPTLAMLEKLLSPRRQYAEDSSTATGPRLFQPNHLPGDTPDTFDSSINPKERPYLQTPVPSVEHFVNQRWQHGTDKQDRVLVYVLERSSSRKLARRVLRKSSIRKEVVDMILGLIEPTFSALSTIATRHLLAILRWYTTEFSEVAVHSLRWGQRTVFNASDFNDPTTRVLWAFHLVAVSRTRYPPAWTPLFQALSCPWRSPPFWLCRDAWIRTVEMIDEMEQLEISRNWDQFTYICRTFSLATVATLNEPMESMDAKSHDVDAGLSLLKREFETLVYSKLALSNPSDPTIDHDENSHHSEQDLPSNVSLRVPSFHELHMFIQALGLAQDHQGLINLVGWMVRHYQGFVNRYGADNARECFPQCFVPIRVFLEGRWAASASSTAEICTAPDYMIDTAQLALASVARCDAWPTEQEMAAYAPMNIGTHPEAMRLSSTLGR